MADWCFINDKLVPGKEGVLHFRDLAIQRGYGIFDFLKVVNAVPVFLDDHLDRFYFSAAQMRLDVGYGRAELVGMIYQLLQRNELKDTGVRLTLTGGYSADGYQLSKPNLVISLHSFTPPSPEQWEKGIQLISYEHQRQLPSVKSIDYLMAIWLQKIVQEAGADDVLYHSNGSITECPRSNIFMVTQDDRILTPSENILKGVTRKKLIEICEESFPVEERSIPLDELKTAKEVFVSSTTKMILPVRQIDEHCFPSEHRLASTLCSRLKLLADRYRHEE